MVGRTQGRKVEGSWSRREGGNLKERFDQQFGKGSPDGNWIGMLSHLPSCSPSPRDHAIRRMHPPSSHWSQYPMNCFTLAIDGAEGQISDWGKARIIVLRRCVKTRVVAHTLPSSRSYIILFASAVLYHLSFFVSIFYPRSTAPSITGTSLDDSAPITRVKKSPISITPGLSAQIASKN